MQMANALKSKFNSEGQTIIGQFNAQINQFKSLIASGDIKSQSEYIKNIGSTGMRKLATTTTDPCLRRSIYIIVLLDEGVAYRLQTVRKPSQAAQLNCNLLKAKAQQLKRCIKK